jgi:hypothetical protein
VSHEPASGGHEPAREPTPDAAAPLTAGAIPLGAPSAEALLNLQRGAGNRAVRGMLARQGTAIPPVWPADNAATARLLRSDGAATAAPPQPGQGDVQQAIALADDEAIEQIGCADELEDPQLKEARLAALNATTPTQRAAMIKVLADLWWTSGDEERAALKLLKHKGEHRLVVAGLDAIGYRQKLLDSVDDNALHEELEKLLAEVPAEGARDDPVGAALASQDTDAVMALKPEQLRSATNAQRLGLLRLLLDMRWSTEAEEQQMLAIVESAGSDLASLVAEVKGLGLKQALFDHIDSDKPRERLGTLLKPLGDTELNEDLEVLNRGFFGGVWEGLKGGWGEFTKGLSLAKILEGLVAPIAHPVESVSNMLQTADEGIDALVKGQSLRAIDRGLALLRDALGFVATWLLVIAGGLALIGLIPGAQPALAAAGALVTVSGVMGIAMLAITFYKFLLDLLQAGLATTAAEHEQEQREIGEDITGGVIGGLLLLLGALVKAGISRLAKWVRAPTTETLPEQGDGATKMGDDAAATGKQLETATKDAEAKTGEQAPPAPTVPPETAKAPTDVAPADPAKVADTAAKPGEPLTPPEPVKPAETAKPSETAAPEEPAKAAESVPPAPDPWATLKAKLGLSDDAVAALKNAGVEPAAVEKLAAKSVPIDKIVKMAADAGAKGVDVTAALVERGLQLTAIERLVRAAADAGALDPLHKLVTSGNLVNPQGLSALIDALAKEAKSPGNPRGKLLELTDAAERAAGGEQIEIGTGGDVVSLTAKEAMQYKRVTSPDERNVAKNLREAINQLSGAKGEMPPGHGPDAPPGAEKFTRVADIRLEHDPATGKPIPATDAPPPAGADPIPYRLLVASRETLLKFLRDWFGGEVKDQHTTYDKVKITNQKGTETFTRPEITGDGN